MGGGKRLVVASDQDEGGGCADGRLRLSGLYISGSSSAAAEEESGEDEGYRSFPDETHQWKQPALHRRGIEPNVEGLVWILSALSGERLHGHGWLDTHATSQYTAEACGSGRSWSWSGPSALAECLLRRLWAVQLRGSPQEVEPVPDGALT